MRSLILGFDSFDPALFEALAKQGQMMNLQRLAEKGGYSPLRVSSPPQTEVSWTSIATGSDPGTHGIFDFVHRNPATYSPYVSILPTHTGKLGTQFVPPYQARTFFEEAVDQGYQATALWWPAMFPARPELPVRTIPGLGTPDIRGQLGVGALYTISPEPLRDGQKTPVESLSKHNGGYRAALKGPMVKKQGAVDNALIEFQVDVLDDQTARFSFDKQNFELRVGQWSPVFEVSFKAGFMMSVHAVTRVILTSTDPLKLYFLPLQLHPLHALWRYSVPKSFITDTWKNCGPFLSLGWPQDTTGLEDGCITDEQFLGLCRDIFASREKVLNYHLRSFNEGVLGAIFDDLDRVQHMFRRTHPEFVADWYKALDQFVGRASNLVDGMGGAKMDFFVMSDHGFADYAYKVHVNAWLAENGYLKLNLGSDEKSLTSVDWANTKAYAIGLNSLYVNLKNREGQGIVLPEHIEATVSELRDRLLAMRGPDGDAVFANVLLRHEAFSGPLLRHGPDLVLGYAPGYRASAETGLGKWEDTVIEVNKDHWEADHCIDSLSVPGVLFANRSLSDFPNPSFRDIPPLVVGKYLDQSGVKPPPIFGDESNQTIEERLKGLGYL